MTSEQTSKPDLGSKNILVVGTARNCAANISSDVMQIRAALKDFKRVSWLVVESDSDDGTFATLEILQQEIALFRFISLGKLSEKYPLRTQRLALCRNTYLRELNENAVYSDTDLVIMADLDGRNNAISAQAINSCFDFNGWGVCAANQEGHYYDIWALRHPLWSPVDCWQQYEFFVRSGVSKTEAKIAAVYEKMFIIPKDAKWIEVESAFGGLAIYQRHVLDAVKYEGLTHDGQEVCEHVSLHSQIRSQGHKIFINPALINSTWTNFSEGYFKDEPRHFFIRLVRAIRRVFN